MKIPRNAIAKSVFFIFVFLLNFYPAFAIGMNAYEVLLDPQLGRQRTSIEGRFDSSSGTTSLTKESLAGYVPLFNGGANEAGFAVSGELVSLGRNLFLPSSGGMLPDIFSDVNFGPAFRHKFSNGWILGGNALAGSSSNRPFANFNTLEFTGNAALLVPAGDGDAWAFFLNYSSNRDFLRHVPLPGFGYIFNREWGRGLIGAPAMNVQLMPRSKLNFNLRYFPIIRLYADAGWNPQRWLRLAGYFQWDDDHFWRTGRAIKNRQIFIVEKTSGASLSVRLQKKIEFKLSGGWRFGRYIFEGRSILKDTGYNRIELDSTPFAAALIAVKI